MFDDATYRNQGKTAYSYFHAAALNYPDNYDLSFDDAIAWLDSKQPNFLLFLGRAILNPPAVDDSVVRYRMTALANSNQGQLPAQLSEFLRVFQSGEVDQYSWADSVKAVFSGVVDAGSEIATNTATYSSDLFSAAASSLKSLTVAAPLIIGVGVLLYVFVKGGGVSQIRGAK